MIIPNPNFLDPTTNVNAPNENFKNYQMVQLLGHSIHFKFYNCEKVSFFKILQIVVGKKFF